MMVYDRCFLLCISISLVQFSWARLAEMNAGPYPVRDVDLARGGSACDTSTEQFLRLEVHDFNDYPTFTVNWRQLTDKCGAPVSNTRSFTATYDVSAGDTKPSGGRVELSMSLCSPFGEYELELDVKSYSEEDSKLEKRVSWAITDGFSGEPIWNTVSSDLAEDERYSPKSPGVYVYPLEGETGFYGNIFAGPFPSAGCREAVPPYTTFVGCYAHGSSNPLFATSEQKLSAGSNDVLAAEACSAFCQDYEFFGVKFGPKPLCVCGTSNQLEDAAELEACSLEQGSRCTCGGNEVISVFFRELL